MVFINEKSDLMGSRRVKEAGKKEEKPFNSRTGGLTPDDVSVEKMFYFGNKTK